METNTYELVLTYGDGSRDVAMVAVADVASIMMISRGWLRSAAGAVSVRCCGVDGDGHPTGVVCEYVL